MAVITEEETIVTMAALFSDQMSEGSGLHSEEKLLAEIHDSAGTAMLYLRQMQSMMDLFKNSVESKVQSANVTATDYIASVKKMDESLIGLFATQVDCDATKFKYWTEVTEKIETVLHDTAQEFASSMQNASSAALSVRTERLHVAKERLRMYTADYQATQVSFGQSASRLNIAIEKLVTKRREITGQLKKIEGGDDIKKLMAAMAESIHGRHNIERERLKLEEDLHNKISSPIRQNVDRFVDEAKNGRLQK